MFGNIRGCDIEAGGCWRRGRTADHIHRTEDALARFDLHHVPAEGNGAAVFDQDDGVRAPATDQGIRATAIH